MGTQNENDLPSTLSSTPKERPPSSPMQNYRNLLRNPLHLFAGGKKKKRLLTLNVIFIEADFFSSLLFQKKWTP